MKIFAPEFVISWVQDTLVEIGFFGGFLLLFDGVLNGLMLGLRLPLSPKNLWNFNLSPSKVTLIESLDNRPPVAAFHQPFYKHLVVAWTDKYFEGLWVLQWNVHIYVMRKANFPQQISVVVAFEGWVEWPLSKGTFLWTQISTGLENREWRGHTG